MKTYLTIAVSFLFTGCAITTSDEYKLPEFNLLMIDSTTILNTRSIPIGKPFVLMYFSPDCDHCQKETEDIIKNMNHLSNVNFYYITSDPFERLEVFRDYYNTNKYPNIVLCKDYDYAFIRHFKPGTTPYSVVYNGNKTAKAIFPGEAKASDFINIIKKIQL